MAELIYLCDRDGAAGTYSNEDLQTISTRILPNNAPTNTEIVRNGGVSYCIINPSDNLPVRDSSVCMGQMIPPRTDWHVPGAPVPDGSYGIIRANSETIELLSDMTASRTLYYYLMDDLFVVSTSQRAVMHFVDSFNPDETAKAWMISSGSLGPSQAWDTRIESLQPDARLQLDRSSWEVTVNTGPAWESFNTKSRSTDSHRSHLENSLDATFNKLELDISHWPLLLTGGIDTRELLFRLQEDPSLRTITWGTQDALQDANSDAVRAQEIAEACNVPNQYHTLPQSPEDVGVVFERFLTAGEGRTDDVKHYTDGFGLFESLAKAELEGIIVGDEGFGWNVVTSPYSVRRVIGAMMISDYNVLPNLSIPGSETQQLPSCYARNPEESLEMWRDRLYHTYRLSIAHSASTALQTPYVEVVSPFLTRKILRTVRTLPDETRTEKQLFADYVIDRSPPVPVATRDANPSMAGVLTASESREFLRAELDTEYARSVLGNEVIEYTLDALTHRSNSRRESQSNPLTVETVKRKVGRTIPAPIIRKVEKYLPVERPDPTMSVTRLAFRLYIIKGMSAQLEEDVQAL